MFFKSNSVLENILGSLKNMLSNDNGISSDVTLVGDDSNSTINAHQFVLAASSTYFKQIFDFSMSLSHQHPVILVLDNISSAVLRSIVEFIYTGVTEIEQNHIDSFLEVGLLLQVEAITKSVNSPLHSKSFSVQPNTRHNVDDLEDTTTNVNADIEDCEDSISKKLELVAEKRGKSSEITHVGTVEEQYVCQVCGNVFRKELRLRDHYNRVHQEKTKIKCNVPGCLKSFKFKHLLSRHFRKVHAAPTHECHDCQKKFHSSYDLKRHLTSVHEGFKLFCEKCGKAFNRKDNLIVHMRNTH